MTAVHVRDFVTAVFQGAEGYVNIRTLKPVEQTFVPLDDLDGLEAFVSPRRDRDCYLGVAARLTPGDGALANCGALPALFVDLDVKAMGEEEARRRLDAVVLLPSITVNSGGGFHVYWLLREPLDLQCESVAAKALLRRLAHHVGADLAAAEPARILRLPSTRNFKYQPARPVTITRFDPDRRYNISDFDEWLPAEPSHPPTLLLPTSDAILAGSRNQRLTRFAGSMRRPGMGEDAILAALRVENANRCRPPLPDVEVCRIARSVAGYPPQTAASATASGPLELTTLRDLLAEPDAAADWLVDDRIPCGGLAMLAGKPKSGKSTAARDLALAVARGGAWVGFACAQRPVIYVALEDRRADVKRHFRVMGATGSEPLRFVFQEGVGDLVARLQIVAAEDRPGLIIVDTLQRVIKARDLNDYAEVTTKLTPILRLARDSGAAVLLIHHAGKSLRADALDSVLGSTALSGSVDNVLLIRRTDQYRTLQSVQRVGPDLPETVLTLAANGLTCNGGTRSEADGRHVQSAILEALAGGPIGNSALLDSIEARRGDKLRALKELVASGAIVRLGTGKKHDPYTYATGSIGSSQVPALSEELPTAHPQPPEMSNASVQNGGSQQADIPCGSGNHKAGMDGAPTDLLPRPAGTDDPLPPVSAPGAQDKKVGR